MEIKICDAQSLEVIAFFTDIAVSSTILDVKKALHREKSKYYPNRQSLKLDRRGKTLKDEETLESISIQDGGCLFLKDLGPQVEWTTVFLVEYAGPLVIYLLFYRRPAAVYGADYVHLPYADVVHYAAGCWTFHYAKRLFETVFVHRFSHATMPVFSLVKNSAYYWGFTVLVSYFVNHPLYTPPFFGSMQVFIGLAAFIFSELGNFSIHMHLRNLRPPGTKARRVPHAGLNPWTWLFRCVSCPNYTYETMAWMAFTVMTQSASAALFTAVGFCQMAVWAKAKNHSYLKEFKDYPRQRKAIVPFIW